jgi:hypothetical protein
MKVHFIIYIVIENIIKFNFHSHLFVKEMICTVPQLVEKISYFSQNEHINKTQITKLLNCCNLERKQNAQSLIVMNQQYERRINVMKAYFYFNDLDSSNISGNNSENFD